MRVAKMLCIAPTHPLPFELATQYYTPGTRFQSQHITRASPNIPRRLKMQRCRGVCVRVFKLRSYRRHVPQHFVHSAFPLIASKESGKVHRGGKREHEVGRGNPSSFCEKPNAFGFSQNEEGLPLPTSCSLMGFLLENGGLVISRCLVLRSARGRRAGRGMFNTRGI